MKQKFLGTVERDVEVCRAQMVEIVVEVTDDRLRARGLTTAAGIWLTTAVGMAVGLGRPATALMVTALALVILSPLRRIEGKLEAREKRRKRAGDGSDSP